MKKIKKLIISLIFIVSIFSEIIFASKNNNVKSKEYIEKEFYSKFTESVNTNDGVKVTIVKSDKFGDFQDEYVAVDVKVENLNRYADLEFNIEVIDHNEFKILNKSKNLTISAGNNEDISFDYKFNKPTVLYDENKNNVSYKKHISFARDTDRATRSYIDERYLREIEKTKRDFEELEIYEKQKTKKTIMIIAIVMIIVIIVLLFVYLIRQYIKTNKEIYHILLIIGLLIVLELCSIFGKNKIYANSQQSFMTNTTYSHTYICEVWHSGVAKTFRFRVNYKYVGDVPIYEENLDSDNDGLLDNNEVYFMTDINNVDTDGDGISDYDEIYIIDTDPINPDSDNNGIEDGEEDFDKDGLTNVLEINLGTSMNNKDSDYDGLNDYDEIKIYYTNPLNEDTDGDGLSDFEEVQVANMLGLNDISSIDKSIKFEQTLSRESIDKSLNVENVVAVSVEGNVSGLIDKHIELKSTNNVSLDNIGAVLGKPILLESDYDNEKVTIKFDCSNYKERLEGLTVATLVDGKIKLLETNLDNNIVSAEVDRGYIFILDGIRYIDNILTYKKDNYK